MEIKNKELSRITECSSENLVIESCDLHCKVSSANMSNSDFSETNLSGASFHNGDMRNVKFNLMGMASATFDSVNMVRSKFFDVGMSGTVLKCVDMDRSDMDGVGMINAIITNSDLTDVTIRGCKINGMTVDGYDVLELIKFYKMNHKN